MTSKTVDVTDLLEHASWLRALARQLVGSDGADDVVQETWIAAIRHPPDDARPVRPWLARVLRNFVYKRAREAGRRESREHLASSTEAEPTAETMLVGLEAQRLLAGLVAELEEPFRSTVLLRYYEGLSAGDVARRQGIPAGTVRWRLAEGARRLRVELDRRHAGNRKAWIAALTPLARLAPAAQTAPAGLTRATWASAGLVTTAALLAAVIWMARPHPSDEARRTANPAIGAAQNDSPTPSWLGQGNVAPVRIAGRVTRDGAPVVGAVVTLEGVLSHAHFSAPQSRTTDEQGRFDFGARTATRYLVTARSPGDLDASMALDTRRQEPALRFDDLSLVVSRCRSQLRGTVRDGSGGVVVGGRIARSQTGMTGFGVVSDESGHYAMCVERGDVSLQIDAEHYGSVVAQLSVSGSMQRDFSLTPEATLDGITFSDDRGNPVANALVRLESVETGLSHPASLDGVSDSSGHFHIAGIAHGRYLVSALAERASTRDPLEIVIAPGTAMDLRVRLHDAARISGVVSEGGRVLGGAEIKAGVPSTARWSTSAISQPDGSFVLDAAPFGTLEFRVVGHAVVEPQRHAVSHRDESVRVEIAARASVAGRVLSQGRAVPNARVRIEGFGVAETRTDSEGHYRLQGLDPGRTTVWADSDESMGHSEAVELLAAEARERVDFELDCTGSIAGMVLDADGNAAANASVHADDATSAAHAVTTTDEAGHFTLAPLCAARYALTLRSSQNESESLTTSRAAAEVAIADAHAHVVDVRLVADRKQRVISGRVVDAAGVGIADAHIVAAPETDGMARFDHWDDRPSATSGIDGGFTLPAISDGAYSLQARIGTGGEAVAHDVHGGKRDVILLLRAPGRLLGELVGLGPSDVIATRADRRGSPMAKRPDAFRARVDGDRFTFAALSPGRYAIMALAQHGGAHVDVDIVAGETSSVVLRNPGTARLHGRVVELRTQVPGAGLLCQLAPRVSSGRAPQTYGEEVWTDAAGAFLFEAAPLGDAYVTCHGAGAYSDGVRAVHVTNEADGVELSVVRSRGPKALIGAVPDWSQIFALEFVLVRPGQPADRAGILVGDVVTAVDGIDVSKLGEQAVEMLIRDRPAGSTAKLGLRRGNRHVDLSLVVGRWQ